MYHEIPVNECFKGSISLSGYPIETIYWKFEIETDAI